MYRLRRDTLAGTATARQVESGVVGSTGTTPLLRAPINNDAALARLDDVAAP